MARNKDFEIEVLGARQLKKRLDAGNLLYIPLRKYFNETGKVVKAKAKQNTPEFSGKLKSQIKYKKVADRGRLPGGVRVFINTPYAPFVHGDMNKNYKYKGLKYPKDKDKFDRTKPHWPPLKALAPWANAKGIPVFLVAKAISEKGTAIVPFIKMGYEQSEKERKLALQLASKRVEAQWKKSRGTLKK
tara:strand:+ start:6839 stop:7402 length:564 start_codon:yes stop_codon:yes gene_type:complete